MLVNHAIAEVPVKVQNAVAFSCLTATRKFLDPQRSGVLPITSTMVTTPIEIFVQDEGGGEGGRGEAARE